MSNKLIGTSQFSLTKIAQGLEGESAKYVIVNGEQVFRYTDTEMLSIPTPQEITLKANVFNINTQNLKWYYKKPNTSNWNPVPESQQRVLNVNPLQLTGVSECIINPGADYWKNQVSLTFACVVDNEFYDEITIVKLAEGETLSAILTNETQTIATNISGGFDTGLLKSIITDMQVFRGTNKLYLADSNTNPQVYQYTLRITNQNNLDGVIDPQTGQITVTYFSETADTGSFDVEANVKLSQNIAGNKTIKKTFTLSKAKQGEKGETGEDAKQVTVSGENLFTVGSDINKTITPNKIKITGVSKNISNPTTKKWERYIGNEQWTRIFHTPGVAEIVDTDNNYGTLTLYPNAFSLQDEHYLLVRYWVDGYYDEMSIAQVSESSGYLTTLTNSTHTVAADKEGGILEGELIKASTDVEAYKNTAKLEAVESKSSLAQGKFFAELIETNPNHAENIIVKFAANGFRLNSMQKSVTTITGKIRIYFESLENYQDKVVTFTKSLTGADGAAGEDAYILSLTKEHGIIKITHNEGVSLSDYDDVYTTANVYQGGKKLPKYAGGSRGVDFSVSPLSGGDITYTHSTSASGDLNIDVTFMRVQSGYLDIQANIKENIDGVDTVISTVTKRFAVLILSEGKDAKYVEIKKDESTFIFENKTISSDHSKNNVSPEFIRLTSFIYNFKPDVEDSHWQYLKTKTETSEVWELISTPDDVEYIHIPQEKAYKVTLDIDPYTYWKAGSNTLSIRYVANNNLMYSDTVTLQRVQDNNKLSATLTNENITISANSEGVVTDFSQAFSNFNVYYGKHKLNDSEYMVELISNSGAGAQVQKVDGAWKIFLTSMSASVVAHTVRVSVIEHDEITNKENIQQQDLVFTVSKALQGVQGPQGPEGEVGPEGPQGPSGPEGPQGDAGESVFVKYLTSGYDKRLIDPLPEAYRVNTTTTTSQIDTLVLQTVNNTVDPYLSLVPITSVDSKRYKYFVVNYRVLQGNPTAFRIAMSGVTNGEYKLFGPANTDTPIKTDGWHTAFIDITKLQDGWVSYPQANNISEFRLHWTKNFDTSIKVEVGWVALTMDMSTEPSDFMGIYTGLAPSNNINDYYWSKLKTNSDYDWVKEWNTNKTQIGDKYIVSPEAFFGRKDTSTELYSGIALNMLIPDDNGDTKGIVGYNNSTRTFTIDSKTGVATFGKIVGAGSNDSYLEVGPDGIVGQINADNIDVKNINATNITTGTLDAEKITVTNLQAESITTGSLKAEVIETNVINAINANIGKAEIDQAVIGDLSADKITAGTIDASKINVNNLNASNITSGTVSADYIKGGTIDATQVNVENLDATNITTGTLDAEQIDVINLDASNINTGTLNATLITTGTLDASKVNVTNLNASNITAGEIDADHIIVKNLDGQYIKGNTIEGNAIKGETITAKHIAANTITSGQIATGTITAGSGVIANGAIGSAQISELDASKINAGTIDTSLVSVASKDASIEISGNQIMVNDTTDPLNKKNRVTLGEYILNGIRNFGLVIRGKDGKTVMIDENGVHNAGITDGAVDNNKISDNANIDGKKLDINSVVRTINEDGSVNISGTKVQVGDKSLNVELSNQNQLITENKTEISSHKTQIKALEDSLEFKVSSEEYERFEETITGQVEDIANNIPYSVQILTTNGTSFVNNNIDTELIARVLRGKVDITNTIPDSDFNWIRESTDAQGDVEWNAAHQGVGNTIHVDADDFHKRAIFNVDVNLPENN